MSVSAVINNVFDRSGFCLRLNVVISEVLCAVLRSAQREAAASTFCHLTVCVCVCVCVFGGVHICATTCPEFPGRVTLVQV